MTYVITNACTDVKDLSCVDVCPVDCIYPIPDEAPDAVAAAAQLYINPLECISCNACAAACPVAAPKFIEDLSEDELPAIAVNATYFAE